ncbi:MAG TPA: sugar ABC transporter substrate-binding protein [Propionibacteriaceae bacterium]|nr:sugar ABC transporter substrate-binding protein [Propionibacteriaceae bacterium]
MRLRKLAGVAAAAVALSLAACGGGGTGGSSGASGGNTTLTWAFWTGGSADNATWQHVADMVHQKYPNITVKLQTASWNDYWTKLPTQLASSSAPCIVGMQMGRVRQFGNLLVPMDDYVSSAGITTGDFNPQIMKALQVNGKQMAIPYDYGPYFVYYNKDQFKSAGLSDPKDGWTVDQFLADAKKLTSGSKYGFALNNSVDALNAWGPTIAGAQAATPDGKLDLTSAAMQKTLSWYAGLQTQDHVAAQLASDSSTTDGSQFLAGNAAMYVSGPWDMINVKTTAKFNTGIVTIPVGPTGQQTTSVGGSGFGISHGCGDKTDAAKAISVITGSDALSYLGSKGRAYPARTADADSWYSSAVPGAKTTLDAALKNGVPYYSTANWTQVGIAYSNGVVPVVNGQGSVSSFLQSVQSSAGSGS